jgi:hypothetical protein
MRILIEARRYRMREGVWPRRLEDLPGVQLPVGQLVDPVSGQPFVYERTGEGFRLYSIGVNKRDDQGVSNIKEGKDDRLYWPIERWEEELEKETENGAEFKPLGGAGGS